MLVTIAALFGLMLAPALALAIEETPTPVKAAAAPVNTVAPSLTGTPALGQTLSCSTGTWANNPTSFSYAWLRSGAPIAGQASSNYVVQAADQGHAISCQVTAGNGGGDYTITGLPSGSYKVVFDSYSENENYLEQFYNGKSQFAEANAVPVTAPNVTGGVNAELHAGGQIAGQAIDSVTKAPIANVFVCAEEYVGGKVEYGGCSTTNSSGDYTVSGLPSGSYDVEFSALFSEARYATQYYPDKASLSEAQSVSVAAGATVGGIDAELRSLDENGQIAGVVTAAAHGEPIANVEVCANEAGGSEYQGGCTETNSSGDYTISGLSAAEYKVYFSPYGCTSSGCTEQNFVAQYFNDKSVYTEATPVPVKANAKTENIDAKLEEGGRIEGTVTKASGGAPVEKVYVCADGVGAAEYSGDCNSTDASGKYVLQTLPTGEYKVTFYGTGNYLTQYYNDKFEYGTAMPVPVTVAKKVENIDAKLTEGGQVTGRVTDASSHTPIAEVEVCAVSGGNLDDCAATNAGGEYTIMGLPSGSYTFSFYDYQEGVNYLSQSVGPDEVEAGTVRSGVNAELHPGGEIVGTITDAATHGGIAKVEVCAEGVSIEIERCAVTTAGGTSTTATSNALTIPGGGFTLEKVSFDSKSNDLDFFFTFPTAGKLTWGLFFKNADVGFADSLGLSLQADGVAADTASTQAIAEAARKHKSKGCKKGTIKHHGKCVKLLVPFAAGSQSVAAGNVEVKIHASSKAIKALKAGHTLHVSGTFVFQSVFGGPAVAKQESAVVHLSKKAAKGKHGKGKKH
jgi:hypothetical protein